MSTAINKSQATLWIGNGVYLILFFLSILLYLERTAFVDISFHLFYILKDNFFAIQNFRFGSILTQAFPLVASNLSLPLKYIMLIYSVGFVVFYWIQFNLQNRVGYQFGLVMLMLSILMVNDTFYWIQSELPQGLALLTLLLAFMASIQTNREKSILFYALFSLLTFTTAFMHPLLIFPFVFGIVFLYLKGLVSLRLFIGSSLSFLGFYLIKTFLFATEYDSNSMEGASNIFKLFPNYLSLESNYDFFEYLILDYYLLLIGFLLVLSYYLYKRSFLLFLLVFLFFAGYTLLVNISYPQGGEQFYMENLYLPLTIFVAYPLAFDVLPHLKGKYFAVLLLFVGIVRVADIYFSKTPYTERTDYLIELIDSTPDQKVVRSPTMEEKETLLMTWATAYEIWLLSTVHLGQTRSLLLTEDPSQYHWAKNKRKGFFTPWGIFDYDELPQPYFHFQDTSSYIIEEQ